MCLPHSIFSTIICGLLMGSIKKKKLKPNAPDTRWGPKDHNLILLAVVEATQCAAVRTWLWSSKEPPQKSPPLALSATLVRIITDGSTPSRYRYQYGNGFWYTLDEELFCSGSLLNLELVKQGATTPTSFSGNICAVVSRLSRVTMKGNSCGEARSPSTIFSCSRPDQKSWDLSHV